jgi:hypothetical protein
MSDTNPTEPTIEDPADSDAPAPAEVSEIKQLREAQAETKRLKAELAVAQRDSAFDRAGIPEDGMGGYFRNGYDGDLDTEAIVAEATAKGLLAAPVEGLPEDEALEDDVALQRITAANAGAAAPTPSDPVARVQEAGKDGYGDLEAVRNELEGLNLDAGDFERMARQG